MLDFAATLSPSLREAIQKRSKLGISGCVVWVGRFSGASSRYPVPIIGVGNSSRSVRRLIAAAEGLLLIDELVVIPKCNNYACVAVDHFDIRERSHRAHDRPLFPCGHERSASNSYSYVRAGSIQKLCKMCAAPRRTPKTRKHKTGREII